jgi:anaerobic selenocysteine-containing dehydrogenase
MQPDGSHTPIASEQAIDEITTRLQGVIERHGPESVAMYVGMGITKSIPMLALADSLMDGIGASRRWSANTLDQPGKQIAHGLHGYWLAPPQAFDEPEVILWIGVNPIISYSAMPHGDPGDYFKECRARGTKIIVIDPRRTEIARRASLHIQARPGEDVAILAGMLRVILNEELYDHEFVAENVEGLETLRDAVRPFTPSLVAARADISVDDLVWTARTFAGAKRGYAVAGTGPNMGTARGTLFEYLVLALDTICGHYLRTGEVVRTPGTLWPVPVFKAQASGPVEAFGFGPKLRFRGFSETLGGLPTSAMAEEILTPGEGQVRALFVVGGNPAVALTDQLQIIEALKSLELLVTSDITMSSTAKLAHYVVAPTAQLEVPAMLGDSPPNVYANAYVGWRDAVAQYTPAIVDPPPGSDVIEEWELYYGIAQRLGIQLALNPMKIFTSDPPPKLEHRPPPINMVKRPTTDEIIEMMTRGARVPLEEVKRHPAGALFPPDPPVIVQPKDPDCLDRLDIGNPLMMTDLAAALETSDVAGNLAHGFEFRLLCRRMHQINSFLHFPVIDRGRPFNPAFMHPIDLERLGLADGDLAQISSSRGSIPAVVMADPNLRQGVVSMAHSFGDTPENDDKVRKIGSNTNRLVRNDAVYDPYSGQPLMSNVPVNVRGL